MSKLLAIAILVACVGCIEIVSTAFADNSTRFSITTKRSDDNVEFKVDDDKTVFTIRSPFGISSAEIERIDYKWPDIVMVQLYLKGFENLRITNGKVTLEASVSSHDAKSPVRLWMVKNEDASLDAKSHSGWRYACLAAMQHQPT